MPELCSRPTRKGTPCRLPLNGGRCATHDCDLAARNAHVRASFAAKHPHEYAAHQVKAGKAGYQAAGARHGWEKVIERARLWRIEHPSEPERWAIGVLAEAGINHYQREYPVLDGSYSVDFAWPDSRRAIEIDGHPSRASADEQVRRQERTAHKRNELTADGWAMLWIDATRNRDGGAALIIDFAGGAPICESGQLNNGRQHDQPAVSESDQTPF